MPDLASLTDAYAPTAVDTGLPVENPYAGRLVVTPSDVPPDTSQLPVVQADARPEPMSIGSTVDKIVNRLTGSNGEERYQTWPEKVIREALSAAHDVNEQGTLQPGLRREDFTDIPAPSMPTNDSTWLGQKLGIAPVAASPADNLIGQAQAISALAGTGGVAGTDVAAGEAALGSTPFLRPALKYGDKIYKAPVNGQHLDALPAHLADTFQRQALSGEDISNFNFGFMNHKGQFLDREKALDYAVKEGLVDPSAGQYGALTSTLLADSSKPGTAIEAMAKTGSPHLEAAIRDNGKVYRGADHLDALSKAPAEDRARLSLDGNNRGWMNDKGRFLNRERAQKYAVENDLIKDGAPSWVPTSREAIAEWIKPRAVLKSDNEAGLALQSIKQPFYSALEHNVNQISQSKMTGDQWLGTLANKPGVKPEELDWTGVKDFLKERGNQPVTKSELQEHLANNKVELKEVNKGGEAGTKDAAFALAKEHGWKSWDEIDPQTQAKYMQRASKEAGENPTKYHSYQLPGAENYREMLMTLPMKQGETVKPSMFGDYKPGENFKAKTSPNVYKSSHWDEPNILAHVRMNDRVIDGKKSLHLEELQSDWLQAGRDKGFIDPKKPYEIFDPVTAEVKGKFATEAEAKSAVEGTKLDYGKSQGVPDAPFKKTWHELALKRMIRHAAEIGADRLSWTPGEAQAARYDLSKQINRLAYDPKTGHLQGFKDENMGGLVLDEKVPQTKLPDFVGKEAADKLLNKPTKILDNGYHTLNNADLKIGGEGMKGFYDQIIPKALEKISGEKVKHGVMNTPAKSALDNWPKPKVEEHPIHYIDIPQSLKDKAMHKGFPLFSNGYMYTPVSGDPFKNEKKK